MRATAVLQATLLCILLACGQDASAPEPTTADAPTASAHVADDGHDHAAHDDEVALAATGSKGSGKKAARAPGERPLPAFGGRTLDGGRLAISDMIGRRLLLFFFNPETADSAVVADAVVEVAQQQQSHNFRVVGVGVGSSPSKVRSFAKERGIEFPVIDDSDGRITSLLGIPGPLLVIGADAEGYVTFGIPGFDTTPADADERIAASLRESLRIATPAHAGKLVQHPVAPVFQTQDIDGKPFDLAEFAGRPKIVMFFLHTCPHCHHALAFFKEQLAKIPEASRPVLAAISLQNRPSAIRIALGDLGLDFFTPLVDPGQVVGQQYGLRGGVPDISMIDAQGRIVFRTQGWREDRDPALMRMYLARIAGEKIPMLLSRKGYTGNDACTVCHEQEAATWELTSHARAFDTLVTHGQERDGECVSCHVVGYDEPGGYSFSNAVAHLENVGCESCHGRGGPHLSPDFVAESGYAGVCASCHDQKHSLGFEFATFLPGVSHTMIAAMSDEDRARRFAEGASHRELLPTTADYVGSEACQSCHTAEFETWAASPHAHAVATLEKDGKTTEADCLTCHTTGFGKPGGFPKDGVAAAHSDLARVGCESCHGPGSEHVAESSRKLGSIVSLGDKCDSCVILQICGSCHDAANDADFEFSVQEHIDRQRHGTIEAGTGKPIGASAFRPAAPTVEAQVAHALRLLEARTGQDG